MDVALCVFSVFSVFTVFLFALIVVYSAPSSPLYTILVNWRLIIIGTTPASLCQNGRKRRAISFVK